jgi:hypothetical protein
VLSLVPPQVREVAGIVRISPAVYSTPDAAVVFFGHDLIYRHLSLGDLSDLSENGRVIS